MSEKLGQEPAFPVDYRVSADSHRNGMSKRFYAAIKLRVPDSGEEWLDEMIRKANRRDAAQSAMQGLAANPNGFKQSNGSFHTAESFITNAYILADELLKQENQ